MDNTKYYEKYFALAKDCGHTHYAALDMRTLEFFQEVRDMCNEGQCRGYNTSWSCPPACPPVEKLREKARSYSGGLLVQTVGELEDSLDWEGIMQIEKNHKKNFSRLCEELRNIFTPIMPMGAGTCALCEKCAYPDSPCRFPEKMSPSMEACGIFVSKLCKSNGLQYNYGQNKIAFTSCVLFGSLDIFECFV